jgi:hypothetical protein
MARTLALGSVFAITLLALSSLTPNTASADASQLCRSVTTIALAPTDVLFMPVIVGGDMLMGFEDQDDHWFPLVAGTVPGILWLSGLQIGGAMLRVAAGVIEFVPGLITLPREKSPKPLFTSQDDAEAVLSKEFGPCPIRIGVHYNTIPWG